MGNACCSEMDEQGTKGTPLLKPDAKKAKPLEDHDSIIMKQIKQIQKGQWIEGDNSNISADRTTDSKSSGGFNGTITYEQDTLEHLNQMNASFFELNEHQTMTLINNPNIVFSRPRLEYQYAEGLPVGRIVTDSYKYIGQVKGTAMHGKGHLQLKTGEIIVGAFTDDQPNAYVAIYFLDGSIVKGFITKPPTTISGQGTILTPSKDRYEGDIQANCPHGQGIFYFADGRRYQGAFFEGKRHGYGVYYWPDGALYKGDWVNGLEHGQGWYKEDNDKVIQGRYKDGKFVG